MRRRDTSTTGRQREPVGPRHSPGKNSPLLAPDPPSGDKRANGYCIRWEVLRQPGFAATFVCARLPAERFAPRFGFRGSVAGANIDRMNVRAYLFAWLLGLLVFGCSRASPQAKDVPPSAAFARLPVRFTAQQRTTVAVPESNVSILLTTSDITHGRVEISISTDAGESVLSPRYLRERDAATFLLRGARYNISARKLVNCLIGDDHAEFEITEAGDSAIDEASRIESFLARIAALSDVRFIRNGNAHSAADAATHLRRKWDSQRDRISSLAEFVEKIATRSSVTGEVYQVELPDKTRVPAAEFYRTLGLNRDEP